MTETILFLHIPKTGGTSLIQIMEWQYGQISKSPDADFLDLSEWQRFSGRFDKQAAAGHIPYGTHEIFRDCRYITILRHPVDRIVSLYHYINQLAGGAVDFWKNLGVTQKMTLLDFVNLPIANLRNGMCRQLVGKPFYFEPTDGWGMTPHYYRKAKSNLKPMQIGITEQFHKTIRKFEMEFGWKVVDIPHLNKVDYPRFDMSSEAMFEVYEAIKRHNEYDILLYHAAVDWSGLR